MTQNDATQCTCVNAHAKPGGGEFSSRVYDAVSRFIVLTWRGVGKKEQVPTLRVARATTRAGAGEISCQHSTHGAMPRCYKRPTAPANRSDGPVVSCGLAEYSTVTMQMSRADDRKEQIGMGKPTATNPDVHKAINAILYAFHRGPVGSVRTLKSSSFAWIIDDSKLCWNFHEEAETASAIQPPATLQTATSCVLVTLSLVRLCITACKEDYRKCIIDPAPIDSQTTEALYKATGSDDGSTS